MAKRIHFDLLHLTPNARNQKIALARENLLTTEAEDLGIARSEIRAPSAMYLWLAYL